MGAEFATITFADKEGVDPAAFAEDIQTELRAEGGDDAYCGHLGYEMGVDLLTTEFETYAAADNHICDEHEKYNLPMLAKYKASDGSTRWMLAGWVPS